MATTPAFPITPPYTPELLPTVQREITYLIGQRSSKRVLELGSGWSTIWWGLWNCEVISFEHDKGWYEEVKKVANVKTRWIDIDLKLIDSSKFVKYIVQFPDNFFDFIFVDCIDEQRMNCISAAINRLKPDGYLIVDDSHWEDISNALASFEFSDWSSVVISGYHTRKTGQVCFHQTSILSRK